jgi:hypothetical protein
MAKLHRRRRLPGPKAKRGKGHHATEMNGPVKADLKEHLGGTTAGREKLAPRQADARDHPNAAPADAAPEQVGVAHPEMAAPGQQPAGPKAAEAKRPDAAGEAPGP